MSSSPSPAPEIRRDVVFGRWVIFSPARSRRPSDLKSHHSPAPTPTTNPNPSCPFCLGRESECAPEIFRIPESRDWRIRVIQNLYPALRRDAEPPPPLLGEAAPEKGARSIAGFGFHDVVIETPRHDARLWDLEESEVGDVVLAYRKRVLQLADHASVKYVQVFKNYGASAGASMAHSHSQMLALPIVPPSVIARLDCMKECYERTGKCEICGLHSSNMLVKETKHFSAIVPFAASYAFEVWIVPREHSSFFHEIDEEKALDIGSLLKVMLQKLSKQLNDPPFNFMIHSAPFGLQSSCLPYTHWFLQIVPQLTVIGGFELGSGCYINSVFPEDAAKVLREVE